MKQIAVILLIALSATANAQEKIVNKYRNGQVASEGVLVQGKENGLWTYYDSTGVKTEEIEFRNGAVHGRLTYFFSNGKIQNQGEFRNGIMNGHYVENYLNGEPKIEGFYKLGHKDSTWTYYNGSGLKYREERHFHDTMLLVNYWEDGKKQTVKDGKGTFTTYYQSGQIKETGFYLNGREDSLWKRYFPN